MALFKSSREKRLWLWTLAVVVAIYSTLGLSRTLAGILRDKGVLSDAIWVGIFLVGATIVAHGLKVRPAKLEIAVWLGIAAVYLFIFLRMAMPEERSHVIEYSVLAIFIFEALRERKKWGGNVPVPALLAILFASAIGVIDECIQALLPQRVFDPIDMAFNAIASALAVGSSVILRWVRMGVARL